MTEVPQNPELQTEQPAEARTYPRFSPVQRFEHMVLIVTFSGLALTGLPQRYADQGWAQTMIALMGGIESIRVLHRILATILMAESIFHGGVITYKLFVLGQRATMIPGIRDLRDAIHWVMFNLGLRRSHPHLPRYNFGEKAEYLAVVWGTLVMIITGFMLWNPIATTDILPGEVIPAARAAHSAEALLAVLAIIIWHMYNVHIRRFNRSMFTGRISHEAMEEEHAEELEQIERGEAGAQLPTDVIERRKRWFWPYAVVMTILLVGGLIVFVTYEDSALVTLPQRQTSFTTNLNPSAGDSGRGAALWLSAQCATCHGQQADGGDSPIGVSVIEREFGLDGFATAIRVGPADMPAYTTAQLSNDQIEDLWAWFADLRAERAEQVAGLSSTSNMDN